MIEKSLNVGGKTISCLVATRTVFTTGCTEWSRGLAAGDRLVDRITRNVLDRLSA